MDGERYLPERAPLDSYGNGGFRFAEMGHRGSLLILNHGMHAWPVGSFEDLLPSDLQPVLDTAHEYEFLIIGTGRQPHLATPELRAACSEAGLSVDCMDTGAAARTYNVLLAEQRTFAAALIAVE